MTAVAVYVGDDEAQTNAAEAHPDSTSTARILHLYSRSDARCRRAASPSATSTAWSSPRCARRASRSAKRGSDDATMGTFSTNAGCMSSSLCDMASLWHILLSHAD